MSLYDAADLLARVKRMAQQPSASEWPQDADWYAWLTEAQLYWLGQLAVHVPERYYTTAQLTTAWNSGPPDDVLDDPEAMYRSAKAIFLPVPADDEQDVAVLRHDELRRVLASTKFQRWDPPWQQALVEEYQRAKLAAGIKTIPEQMAEQQAQAEAQAQAEQQAQQAQQEQAAQAQATQVADRERQQAEGSRRGEETALKLADTMAQIVQAVRPEPMAPPAPLATPQVNVVIPRPTKVKYGEDGRVEEFLPQ